MKKFHCLVFALFIYSSLFCHTFRHGFDKRDASSSGGYGQGVSFYSNVGSDVHNVETVYLKEYINMFQATHDKKYFVSFSEKRVENQNEIVNNSTQDSIEESQSKWFLSLTLGGNYLFPDFFTYKDGNKFKLGYGSQVILSYFLTRSLTMNAGLAFNSLRTESIFEGPLSSGADSKTFYSNYNFLQLPVGFAIRFNLNGFYAQFGLENSIGFLFDSKQRTYDDIEGYDENEDLFAKNSFVDFINLDFKFGYSFRKFEVGLDNIYSRQIIPLVYYTTGTSGNKYANKVYLSSLSSCLYIGFRF